MRLSPGQCLASLGPWTELLSLPADAQAPPGTAGWLGTGQWGWPLTPPSLPAPDLVSRWSGGCSCLASNPRGRVCGPAPVPPLLGASLKLSQLCTSLRNNLFKHIILPAIVGERHFCYLHTEGVEAALYPQVWL